MNTINVNTNIYDEQCLRRLESAICACWYGGYTSHKAHNIIADNGTKFYIEPEYRPDNRECDFNYPTAVLMLPSGNWVYIEKYLKDEPFKFTLFSAFQNRKLVEVTDENGFQEALKVIVKNDGIDIAA